MCVCVCVPREWGLPIRGILYMDKVLCCHSSRGGTRSGYRFQTAQLNQREFCQVQQLLCRMKYKTIVPCGCRSGDAFQSERQLKRRHAHLRRCSAIRAAIRPAFRLTPCPGKHVSNGAVQRFIRMQFFQLVSCSMFLNKLDNRTFYYYKPLNEKVLVMYINHHDATIGENCGETAHLYTIKSFGATLKSGNSALSACSSKTPYRVI